MTPATGQDDAIQLCDKSLAHHVPHIARSLLHVHVHALVCLDWLSETSVIPHSCDQVKPANGNASNQPTPTIEKKKEQ